MANGLYGISDERRLKLEKPLIEIDPILDEFARTAGATLTRNDHGEIERSIRFPEHDGIRRKLQIFLSDEGRSSFKVWAVAAEDRDDGRYWCEKTLATLSGSIQFNEIQDILRAGKELLGSWKKCHLKRGT